MSMRMHGRAAQTRDRCSLGMGLESAIATRAVTPSAARKKLGKQRRIDTVRCFRYRIRES